MIETLLGGLLGGTFRLAPEILKWIDRKGERGHELAMQDKALEFESVYFVRSADFNRYADIQQSINLKIYRRMSEHDIAFAIAPQGVIARHTPEAENNAPEIVTDARAEQRPPPEASLRRATN